jgi:multidrug efflux system membrane fusion protein
LWLVVAVVGLAFAYAVFVRPFLHSAANPRGAFDSRPVPVVAEPAHKADLNVRIVSLGTVTPLNTVTVRSLVDGQLQKIYFTEGQMIAAGAPLAEVDPRPFEVQKQQAEALLARDNSLLDNARLDLERFRTLLEQDSVAKQQVDTQEALVRQSEATVKLDQAQIDTAALQLAYAHITAPISGRIGLRLVDTGNLIHPSDVSGLAVITQLQPITVLFSIPQSSLPKVLAKFHDSAPLVVEAFDQDGHTLLATGKLVTVDNQIDPTTGTVRLRAEFPNTDEVLFPNQFVNVQLISEKIPDATVVPTGAVQRGTAGTYVFVVKDNQASLRVVETGVAEHNLTAITKGLAPGEVVVVDGVDKLREGSAVELISPQSGPTANSGAKPEGAGDKSKHGGKRPPQS